MGAMTAKDFLAQTGLEESLLPGQVKYKKHVSEKEGNSYTIKWDWKTNHNEILVEVIPGLTGKHPSPRELSKYAVWLQTKNSVVFELGAETPKEHKQQEEDVVTALKAVCSGKASLYQSLATKVTNTAKIVGEKLNQIPIAVDGAKQICKIALGKAFHKSSKKQA